MEKKHNVSDYIQLQQELEIYQKVMAKASDMILNQDVSDYPIFVVHQQEVEIGIPIAEKGKVQGNWSVHASSLEEFVSKNIVQEIKVDSFKTIYKSPAEQFCCFVLSELGAQFVFIPRK